MRRNLEITHKTPKKQYCEKLHFKLDAVNFEDASAKFAKLVDELKEKYPETLYRLRVKTQPRYDSAEQTLFATIYVREGGEN